VLLKLLEPLHKNIDARVSEVISRSLDGYLESGDKVLDFGCGSGVVGKRLVDDFGVDLTGVDVIDVRRENIPFEKIGGDKVPFSDNYFAHAIVSSVLHHTSNHKEILDELKRVCKSNIFIFEDTPSNFAERISCEIHGHTFNWLWGVPKRHKFRSREEWSKVFKEVGLTEKKVDDIYHTFSIYNPQRTMFVLGC